MNQNGWAQYAPPGMAYAPQPMQTADIVPQSQYYIPQQYYKADDHESKTIKRTALCCTIAVIAGVAVGVAIGYTAAKHHSNHRGELNPDNDPLLFN